MELSATASGMGWSGSRRAGVALGAALVAGALALVVVQGQAASTQPVPSSLPTILPAFLPPSPASQEERLPIFANWAPRNSCVGGAPHSANADCRREQPTPSPTHPLNKTMPRPQVALESAILPPASFRRWVKT